MRPTDPKRKARFAELIALAQAEAAHAVGVHAPRYARKLALLLAFSDRCALVCARMADPLTWALEEPEATSPSCWSNWSKAAAKHQPSLP